MPGVAIVVADVGYLYHGRCRLWPPISDIVAGVGCGRQCRLWSPMSAIYIIADAGYCYRCRLLSPMPAIIANAGCCRADQRCDVSCCRQMSAISAVAIIADANAPRALLT
jgi:hypothetical protein